MLRSGPVVVLILVLTGVASLAPAAAPRVKVADDKHFLATSDGKPFFYLGDTAWELFHRLNREEAERYLKDRAEKRFTVIQAVVLAELDGLNTPNAYGHTPLVDNDPTKPNEEYFKHVDWIVNKADELGLVIGMLPTWGDKWYKAVGQGGIFTPENARQYGEFVGRRYRDKPIIWILGGDRAVENDTQRAILRAMAEGLIAGDGGAHPITFHPRGQGNSAQYFHDEPWLSFNLWQNGHCDLVPVWDRIGTDYKRTPVKPVMDGEPLYEDHPICFNAKERGTSNAADVRRFAYWDVFSGACGHTYGNHAVWQMYDVGRKPINGPLMPWHQAIDRPGAGQMQYVRALVESRPYFTRVPGQDVLALETKSGVNAGLKKIVAARDSGGSYALVYTPASRVITVDLTKISGGKARAWWYSPRDGKATLIGEFPTTGKQDFEPPMPGEMIDWVLVLDDATKNYPPPGTPQ
jgi:hypothetical protein